MDEWEKKKNYYTQQHLYLHEYNTSVFAMLVFLDECF